MQNQISATNNNDTTAQQTKQKVQTIEIKEDI
jgi:hypothetical protein